MNWIQRIFQAPKEESRGFLSNPAKWFLDAFGYSTSSGQKVSSRDAMAINAVYVSAKIIGEIIASQALDKGIKKIIFDRGGYLYHGRVKALADSAREHGLEF